LPGMLRQLGARVYLVQICNVFGDSIYVPLAAGMLRAHARAQPELARHYRFEPLLNERFDLSQVGSRFVEPAVVGLSTYVWNWEYSLALAGRLKELHPNLVIVVGGPQVPGDCRALIASGLVDVAVHGEGEIAFSEVLDALRGGRRLESVAGITARVEEGIVSTPPRARLDDLDQLPSPFLGGDFDPLLAEPKQLIGLWETNRGCPFGCTFCYWGSAVNTRLREFAWERLVAELDWFARHRIDYVLSADANFGIKKRDLELARRVAEAKRRHGFPRKFRVFSTKNASARVLDVVDVLRREGLDQGMSLTMQSLSPATAEAIGRKNIKLESYVELRREAGRRGMTTYCDLIVGLPGETYDSFLDGLERLMRLGQHDNVHVYTCTLLVGSEMASPEYRERHGIVTARSPIIERHMRADAIKKTDIVEYEDVVIATSTMPLEAWIETNLATVLVNVLHYQKLFHWIPIWLHHTQGLGYRRFYEWIKQIARSDPRFPRLGALADFTIEYYRSIARGAQQRLEFPEFGQVVWPIEEAVFLLASRDFDGLYAELRLAVEELCREVGIQLDRAIFDELVKYQLAQVPRPHGPLWAEIELEHDFPSYFGELLAGRPAELRRAPVKLQIVDQHANEGDLARYALKVAWYARSATDIPYRLAPRAA
jgi:radical SAM superfamily enzyme YgiQ (UPF0313 family)